MQDQVAMLSILTQRKVFSTLSPQVQAQVLAGVEQISRATWHHSRLFAIAGAMTIWDAAVSFSTERRVIWKAKPSITKYCYIWTRYMGLLTVVVELALAFGWWKTEVCKRVAVLISILPLAIVPPAQYLLGVRSYALWGHARWVAIVLAVPWLAHLASQTFVVWDTYGTYVPLLMPNADGKGGCFPSSRRLDGLSMLLMASASGIFDFIASGFIFAVCYRIVREKRKASFSSANSDLVTLIWRESILYWVVVAFFHCLNLAMTLRYYGDLEMMALLAAVTVNTAVLLTLKITLHLKSDSAPVESHELSTISLNIASDRGKLPT